MTKMQCVLASLDLWSLWVWLSATKPACWVRWQARCVLCMLLVYAWRAVGLANAAFSVRITEQEQAKTNSWNYQVTKACCLLLSSFESSGAVWILQGMFATWGCAFAKQLFSMVYLIHLLVMQRGGIELMMTCWLKGSWTVTGLLNASPLLYMQELAKPTF